MRPKVPRPTPPKSKYRGVCWHKKQNQWRVSVVKWGKRFYREFRDEEVAARVYDMVAKIVHGPDAQLNFPEDKGMVPPEGITRNEIIAWLVLAKLVRPRPTQE